MTEKLAAMRNRLRMITVAILMVLILSLILVLAGQPQAGMILGTVTMVFFLVWRRRANRAYSDRVGEINILNGLAAPLKNPKYLGNTGLTEKDVDGMAMLPIRMDGHGLLARQGFEGRKDGGICRGWEITLHYQRGNGRTDYAFLSGTLLTKSFDKPLKKGMDWVLLRRDLLADGVAERFFREKEYTILRTGNEALDGELLIGTRTGCDLPEDWIARITGISTRLEQIGAIRCTADGAAVFLDHRFYTYSLKVRDLPTEEQLKANPLPERDDIGELFDFFQKEERE